MRAAVGGGASSASLRAIRHAADAVTFAQVVAERLRLSDIARCELTVDRELLFEPYGAGSAAGSALTVEHCVGGIVALPAERGFVPTR